MSFFAVTMSGLTFDMLMYPNHLQSTILTSWNRPDFGFPWLSIDCMKHKNDIKSPPIATLVKFRSGYTGTTNPVFYADNNIWRKQKNVSFTHGGLANDNTDYVINMINHHS